MKNALKILLTVFLISCHDSNDKTGIKRDIPPFVLNENCNNDYYIRLKIGDREIILSKDSVNHSYGTMTSSFSNVHGKGVWFKNNATEEEFDISFFIYDIKTIYSINTEDYRYIYPLNPEEGIYVNWIVPIEGQQGVVEDYFGTNTNNSYFYITHIDDEQMCGEFRTTLNYCCAEGPDYEVEGDFSIPTIKLP
jgi:hypothetical protein